MRLKWGAQSRARRGTSGVWGAEGAVGGPAVQTPWESERRQPLQGPGRSPWTPHRPCGTSRGQPAPRSRARRGSSGPPGVKISGLRPPRLLGDTRVTTATGTRHHPRDGCARPDAAPRPVASSINRWACTRLTEI